MQGNEKNRTYAYFFETCVCVCAITIQCPLLPSLILAQ